MKKLIMCRGLPASGKSTWAKEMVDKHPGKYKRVNKDDLRAMIDNSKWSKSNEKFILEIRNDIITLALQKGLSVIVDDTNFAPEHEKQLISIAMDNDAAFEIENFDTPVDVCIERDSKREKPVGKAVIMDMYNRYLYKETPRIPHNPRLRDCIICDIDGTLANNDHRNPFDQERVGDDAPINEVKNIVYMIKNVLGIEVIITTGRMNKDNCEKDTIEWLRKYNIPYNLLLMRKDGDTRKDSIVKQEMYEKNIKGKYNVQCVFDDRPQVVRMWRSLGLFVFDVNQSGKDF